MAITQNTDSQRIAGDGKQILVLTDADHAALNSLLYELADEEKLRAMAARFNLALGSNHIESLVFLWQKLNSR